MYINYFKPRGRFDFAKNTLDIGNPFTWDKDHFLMHLFKRIFALSEDRLKEFYNYRLDYYLVNDTKGSEELKPILSKRQLKVLTGYIRRKTYHDTKGLAHLKKFTAMLISLDQWNIHKSNDYMHSKCYIMLI